MPVFPFPPVEWNDIAPRTQSRTQGCAHIGTGAALIRPEPPCRNFHDGKADAPHRGLGGIDFGIGHFFEVHLSEDFFLAPG